MGTYIIATLLFLALAYALYKIFSKRGKCCGNCGCCGNDSDGCCGGGGNCCGGHHHDHDADEVFTSWGKETAHKYSREDLDKALHALDEGAYGMILRAKGIVDGGDTWYEFDMVPGEHEIRTCGPDVTGKLCVIGSELKEHEIAELFHV